MSTTTSAETREEQQGRLADERHQPDEPSFALALGYIQQHHRRAGIGTLFSLTLPISIAMLLGWFLLFCLWYAVGLPLGPGVPVR